MNWKFWRKETPQNSLIEEHIISGVRFRIIKGFGNNMYNRFHFFQTALDGVSLGMRRHDIIAAMEIGRQKYNEGDHGGCLQYMGAVESNLKQYDVSRVIWEVANTFILLEDEKEDEIDANYSLRKRELCKVDKKIEFFFLNNGTTLLRDMKILSEDSKTEDFLKNGKKYLEEQSLNMIGKQHSSD